MLRQPEGTRQSLHPIREEREKQRLSREGLAYRAGISVRTLERIEARQVSPHRATLRMLADALNVRPHDLTEEAA